MKYAFGTALVALALAGCSGGSGTDADTDGDGKVTSDEMAAENAKDGGKLKPQPGKYKVEMTFVSIEGLPKEMQDMMGSRMNTTREFCMTEEMADRGFGRGQNDFDEDDDCTIDKYDIEGNQIDMQMSCKAGEEAEMEMSMKGTVSPTSSDVTMITKGMMGDFGDGSVEMKMKQERIGDCDA